MDNSLFTSWLLLAPGGWIGDWSPGIGDPTFAGWFTVLLYFVAGVAALRVSRLGSAGFASNERWFWRALTALLFFLGLNKQLDLQTAFTEMGRLLAYEQGWYEQRRRVQYGFIVLVGIGSLAAGALCLVLLRRAPRATWLAAASVVALLLFVFVRASSFHRVDVFLGNRVGGLRWNWVLEIGALCGVLLAARWRLLVSRSAGPERVRVKVLSENR